MNNATSVHGLLPRKPLDIELIGQISRDYIGSLCAVP